MADAARLALRHADDLRAEGLVRELTSRVQGARKELDLGYTERIGLTLYADEPVPEVYQPYCQDPAQPVALALLLSRNQGDKMHFSRHSAPAQQASEQQVLQLLPLLQQQCNAVSIAGRQCFWHWQRG